MLRITRLTDYGIVLLCQLAGDPERRHAAPELAARTGLGLPIVSKILKLLTRAGILESQRGAKGGYLLQRPPEEITVAEIIAALEGPIALTECTAGEPGLCEQEPTCPQRANWQVINRAIRRALEQVSLAQMARPLEPAAASRLVALGSRARPAAAAAGGGGAATG